MDRISFDRISVLVVDDNMYMRKIVRTLLMGFGIRTVFEAEDGAAGLESFEQNGPDIIITDWVMPIIDGIEMVQMIRRPESNNNPFVPIIMLSGHAERFRVEQARDAGVHEFLCKPISARSLYMRLYSVIAFPRPFVRTEAYFGPDRRRMENANYNGNERRASTIELEDDDAGGGSAQQDNIDAIMAEADNGAADADERIAS